MKVVILTTDNREHQRTYDELVPRFCGGHYSLLEGFARTPDLEVHIVSCTQRPLKSPEKIADNIWYHALDVPKIGWMRTFYQGCIRAVRKKAAELQPDIVHGHGTERDCAISAAFSGYPNLVTIHGNMAAQARQFKPRAGSYLWLAARLETITLRKTLGVFCNSTYTQDLARPRARKTWLVPHALRLSFRNPPPTADPRPCVLLNAGVISARKRQLELLEVAEDLNRNGIRFELRFIGFIPPRDDGYSAEFLKAIKPLEARGYARFIGAQPEDELVRCYDSVAGVVHFPSEEAFGNVAVEALSRNLKFFGSRVGGIIDIADSQPDAELFEKDDWSGLKRGIQRWIQAGHPRPQNAAAEVWRRYHPEVIAARHVEIYREVLDNRS